MSDPSLLEKALAVVDAAEMLIAGMSVEMDDPRLSYLVCQVYRGDVRRLREAIAKLDKVQP